MKIEDLEKTYDEIMSKKQQIELELKDLEAQKAMKENESQTAADAGDLDLYRSIKAEIEGIEECIFVKAAQLRKIELAPFDEETVVKAWDKYAGDYGKKFDKLMSEYEKARHALFQKYMQIINFQNDALRMRERCGCLMGIELCPPYTNGDNYYPALHFKGLNAGHNPNNRVVNATDDTMYFSACGFLSDQETIDKVNRVINTHSSY